MPRSASLRDLAVGLSRNAALLVTQRCGLGVGLGSPDYLQTLRHTFLICQEGESSGLCVIVDPSFREQFVVAGLAPTTQYAAAVAALPSTFVGTIGTIHALTVLLSHTLAEEARALGLELPPWRSRQALLSKWLPRRFADEVHTSRAGLHPALRSSVHGAKLSSSPKSVQGWQAGPHPASLASTGCTAHSHGSTTPASSCASRDAQAAAALSAPHHVVKGFSTPAPPAGEQGCAPASLPPAQVPGSTCGHAPAPRSALTAQLAAAAAAARNVPAAVQEPLRECADQGKLQAQANWQQQQRRQGPAACQQQGPQRIPICGGGGAPGCKNGADGVVHAIVVSPAHRRCTPPSLKRSCGASSLKLSAATLKLLPRIYTVQMAGRSCLYADAALQAKRMPSGPKAVC
ncbi:hypothetical protein TSOC_006604 [Tetrabaena socialis]|uniref:Uncharacterized protein n=1 Tax=Tetrabaena socialis TaxID=47790 RepID=A0A2J8A387_9CHLO|nr:hypothetical protein TSOC_006604 [Tetrabaena socialis]|eukprot:PNH06987.1 hypothetical protein TSOC_006604 [Tetrabaena socialis]